MSSVKLGVCEAPAVMEPGDPGWSRLVRLVRAETPDVFLLNEMPFGPWMWGEPEFDLGRAAGVIELHERGVERLGELGVRTVLGSRVWRGRKRLLNEGFVWTREAGLSTVHTKQYFPEEPAFFERRWFERGRGGFEVFDAGGIRAGYLICTEVMFNEWARHYGRSGAQLILVPRAAPASSLPRWKTAMSMAAIVSGCYVASSNRYGTGSDDFEFGGAGWIFDPGGNLVAQTSSTEPVAVAELDLQKVTAAQRDYPCYVDELP